MRAIGFWWSPWSDRDQCPHPTHLVDPHWDPSERSTVLNHLRASEPWREFLSTTTCAFCDHRVGNTHVSDGTWCWPLKLAHEVEHHAVRLPDEFVAAAAAGIRTPVDPEVGIPDLAWWSQWARHRGACIDVDPAWLPVKADLQHQLWDLGHRECTELAWRTDGHDVVLCAEDRGYRLVALRTGAAGPVSTTFTEHRERFGPPPGREPLTSSEVQAWADELTLRRRLDDLVLWIPHDGADELLALLATRGYTSGVLAEGLGGRWHELSRG